MMFGFKKWRRKRIRSRPFPPVWEEIIRRNVPFYCLLPDMDRKELQEHVLVFMAEKNFEGCGGLEVTDEIRVTIAAQACILLLHRNSGYYRRLYSILVYPGAFVGKGYEELAPGHIVELDQVHLGESWKQGALILSWDDVEGLAWDQHASHNVVLHEFAHQLDTEDGRADGAPILPHGYMYAAWARILSQDYEKLREDAALGRPTLLDYYGATDPAEFFAVATECFFQKPVEMQERHPELYDELMLYYQQDPARLVRNATEGRCVVDERSGSYDSEESREY